VTDLIFGGKEMLFKTLLILSLISLKAVYLSHCLLFKKNTPHHVLFVGWGFLMEKKHKLNLEHAI